MTDARVSEQNKKATQKVGVWLVVAVLALLFGSAASNAQPIKPAYNIGDYEYLIGGYDGPFHNDPDAIWPYMDSLGVVIPFLGNLFPAPPDSALGVLLDTTDQSWRSGRRFVPTGPPQLFLGGFGREIVFYAFDSVQSTLWPCKFHDYVGHTTPIYNQSYQEGWQETVYENTSEIGQIATTIAINAASLSERTFQKNRLMLSGQYTGADSSRCGYFVVTGHLFDSLNNSNNDAVAVFRVAVYHQLDSGRQYLNNSLGISTAGSGGLDILVDSFAVTRGELRAGPSTWVPENYREISHRSDLWWRAHDNGPGPLHPNQPNAREQALDIRVYWTGAEKAALRSVAFRDSLGELVLGTSQSSIDFRDSMIREARRVLQGSATAAPTDPIHPAIFRLEAGQWRPTTNTR
jgi:hypothetical protein